MPVQAGLDVQGLISRPSDKIAALFDQAGHPVHEPDNDWGVSKAFESLVDDAYAWAKVLVLPDLLPSSKVHLRYRCCAVEKDDYQSPIYLSTMPSSRKNAILLAVCQSFDIRYPSPLSRERAL